jgi:murein tripeptide amidase MpaA
LAYIDDLKHPIIEVGELEASTEFENSIDFVLVRDSNGLSERKSIVVVGGMDGTAASVSQAIYTIESLIDKYDADDPEITYLLQTTDVYVIPMLNPDSYQELALEGGDEDTMSRKNMNDTLPCDNRGVNNFGVNLNRNWAYKWGIDDIGSSNDPCDEEYRGSEPESEIEVAALAQFLSKVNPAFYLSYFAGKQEAYVMPYSYDAEETEKPEQDEYIRNLRRLVTPNVFIGTS